MHASDLQRERYAVLRALECGAAKVGVAAPNASWSLTTRLMRIGLGIQVDKEPQVWEQICLVGGTKRWVLRPGPEGLPEETSAAAVCVLRVLTGMVEMGEQGARARVAVEALLPLFHHLGWRACYISRGRYFYSRITG